MYFNHDTENADARNRLANRLADATNRHDQSLRKEYHIDDTDVRDWSVADAIEAIKTNQFIYRNEKDSKDKGSYYYRGLDIRFRDPEKPADRDGYEKAMKAVHAAHEAVMDHIIVGDPKDALKKVDSHREHKFH